MQWLGERSFGIYLLHPLVIFSLMRAGVYVSIYQALKLIGAWAYVPCAGLTAAIVLSAAAMTYRFIEMPGQRVGANLIRWLDNARRPVEVPAE
jgi:peptidoglycan/LPS O-acetylase OafA/YrhL